MAPGAGAPAAAAGAYAGAAAPRQPNPESQEQGGGHGSHPEGQPPRQGLLLIIIDGVGDVSVPAFGDRTPLQVAHTPNLDAIAGG
jgi:hypothetical protein